MKLAVPFLPAAAFLMAGCSDDPAPVAAPTGDDDRTASGDVQEGSISDAMLPLDQIQSQSPPLAKSPETSASDGSDSEGNVESGDTSPDEEEVSE